MPTKGIINLSGREFTLHLIPNNSRTAYVSITGDSEIIVKAKRQYIDSDIMDFVKSKKNWIMEKVNLQENNAFYNKRNESSPSPGKSLLSNGQTVERLKPTGFTCKSNAL